MVEGDSGRLCDEPMAVVEVVKEVLWGLAGNVEALNDGRP